MIIKWIKGVLVAVVLAASVIIVYGFVTNTISNKEEKLTNREATPTAEPQQKFEEVIRYGTVYKFSTSGVMEFYYYDMEKGSIVTNWQIYPWFNAGVDNIHDDKTVDNFVNYVSEHENYVFKIVGEKEADDCDFYQDNRKGVCLEQIIVKEIIAVQKIK